MSKLHFLLAKNKKWSKKVKEIDSGFLQELAHNQKPSFFWVGCSDSRVVPTTITDSNLGEIFVIRNIANLFLETDMNSMSALQYAVEFLNVTDIIVCGHYNCGGICSSFNTELPDTLNNYIAPVRNIYKENEVIFSKIKDKQEKLNKLVELNVKEQIENIYATQIYQNASTKREINLHGLIYDLKTGVLNELNLQCNNITEN